jgi:Putative stress-induced transcription regulator
MTPVTVTTTRLFGDHPVLDFTNTVHSRGADFGPDVLTKFCDLLSWGLRVGVIETAAANELRNLNAKRGKAALGRAKTLREALYRIFATHPSAAEADLDLLQRRCGRRRRCGCSCPRRAALPGVGGLAIPIRLRTALPWQRRI